MRPEQSSWRAFYGVSALLFVTSAAATIVWCASSPAMSAMPMIVGSTTSMAWMWMPGQSWPSASSSFLSTWIVMMAAMMLPSLVPMLQRYRQAVDRTDGMRLGPLTVLVGAGYFSVWSLTGITVFLLGTGVASAKMQLLVLGCGNPFVIDLVVLVVGVLQCSTWKAHHLACCREAPGHEVRLSGQANSAWRYGLFLGLHCNCACAGPMAILLVFGIMDLRAMILVTAAITAERLAPGGVRVARITGAVMMAVGLFLIFRAIGLGMDRPVLCR